MSDWGKILTTGSPDKYLTYDRFFKNQTFTTAGSPQSLHFRATFSPIYLLQEAETEESIFTEKFIYRSIQIP